MKLIKVAEPGKMMSQPHGPKPSGKLDTQIFLEKEDPSHVARRRGKKKSTKKKSEKQKKDSGCSECSLKRGR
jgi:hypothetical protein